MVESNSYMRGAEFPAGGVGDIFDLIRSGGATSRSTLARMTGLSASTVSLRVDSLERLGLVTEQGQEESRGGRRARMLQVDPSAGFVVAIDFGAHHLKLSVADLAGTIHSEIDAGPLDSPMPAAAVVEVMWNHVTTLVERSALSIDDLRGIAISLPAPIDYPSGRVVLPSFMPSWHNVSLPLLFAAHTAVPILVENDANLVALAETSGTVGAGGDQLLAVVLGTRIGSGIVYEGRLHRGFSGAAGEISHSTVSGTSTISCICGIPNCLESVASGGAIAARLTQRGFAATSARDVVALGQTAEPVVVAALRDAGAQIGQVLASVVNFLNPREVVLSGVMSISAPLVAAIRAELFQRCLPIVTNELEVRAASDPATAVMRGAVKLALQEVLAVARIDRLARDLDTAGTQTA